jgi:hypothetical protein
LVGVAPGVIMLPKDETVPIEIGIAQLKASPLYSFQFGPKEIKNGKVDLVATRYQAEKGRDVIYLAPNVSEQIWIDYFDKRSYSIRLPSGWDTGAGGFLNKRGYRDAFVANDGKLEISEKYASGAPHVAYSAEKGMAVNLQNPINWSGARVVGYQGGMFNPYLLQTEKWTIISNPTGATIFTADGEQGKTTSTISITKSLSAFVVLQLDGYQQCAHVDCDKKETPGSIILTCNLKKLQ